MRILVVSDTHGDLASLVSVVNSQQTAEIIVHCGDGDEQVQYLKNNYKEKMVVAVRGNCDWCSSLPVTETISVMGKKIFITHGHMYNVKSTLYELANEAISQKADIVLFGHTHNRYSEYRDEIHFLNPGSLHGYGASYGFVDITDDGGIITNIVSVK